MLRRLALASVSAAFAVSASAPFAQSRDPVDLTVIGVIWDDRVIVSEYGLTYVCELTDLESMVEISGCKRAATQAQLEAERVAAEKAVAAAILSAEKERLEREAVSKKLQADRIAAAARLDAQVQAAAEKTAAEAKLAAELEEAKILIRALDEDQVVDAVVTAFQKNGCAITALNRQLGQRGLYDKFWLDGLGRNDPMPVDLVDMLREQALPTMQKMLDMGTLVLDAGNMEITLKDCN